MLIKLQEHADSGAYHIFENVTDVIYFANPVPRPEPLSLESAGFQFFYDPNRPMTVQQSNKLNFISFTKNGEEIKILFDGEAFICSDTGHTIQKVRSL